MADYQKSIEKWGMLEVTVQGCADGNPFVEREIFGTFTGKNECVKTAGFYDGDGIYKVRFMPSFEGSYTFKIEGTYGGDVQEGAFEVTAPQEGNHGPVRVANTWHFAYEDGTPYYSVGTTCYVWNLQSDELIEQTLQTLKESAFNKIRFCIFPKHYDYNLGEPRSYPYEGTPMDSSVLTKENFNQYNGTAPGNHFDLTRFNPEHFRHIESCIERLQELGIEADLIVMHPYDRWGFSEMTREEDTLYWSYVIARLSAYRNVWWSLANEHDFMPKKNVTDWEWYAKLLCERDPYSHLRSIHNGTTMYDHNRPWVTHCSLQRQDLYKAAELVGEFREKWRKPIVMDEIAYEGNIQHGWGNITGQEMTRRFWETAVRGGYPGHGETYMHPQDILWWSHGGELHGDSPERFKLLLDIMKETPGLGLCPHRAEWDDICGVPECDWAKKVKSYYLYYYSFMRPSFRDFYFDDTTEFEVNVIDTWEMTVENRGTFRGKFRVELPGKQYMAIQIKQKK